MFVFTAEKELSWVVNTHTIEVLREDDGRNEHQKQQKHLLQTSKGLKSWLAQ